MVWVGERESGVGGREGEWWLGCGGRVVWVKTAGHGSRCRVNVILKWCKVVPD